jgi:iron-sulfur cluster repair protein YtfE (RIC family)
MLAQLIKRGAPEYKGLPTDTEGKVKYARESWENELKTHFLNEESILFPSVKGKISEIDDLIEALILEHREIAKMITDLEVNNESEEKLNELGEKLENHIRKEERILFQQLQLSCFDELENLTGKILPAKNVCKT